MYCEILHHLRESKKTLFRESTPGSYYYHVGGSSKAKHRLLALAPASLAMDRVPSEFLSQPRDSAYAVAEYFVMWCY